MTRKITLVLAASALFVAFAASAQQAPQSQPPKPKAKKVWTDEDISSVRTASDLYADKKAAEAEKARQAEAEKAAEKSAPAKPAEKKPKDHLPTTIPEAEKRLAAKQYEITMQYEAVDLVKKEQAQATTPQERAAFQKRIDDLSATLEESVAEMHAIDARLQELKAKSPAAGAEAAPAAGAPSAPDPVAEIEKQIAEKREKIEVCNTQIQQLRDAVARADSEVTRASLQKKLDNFTALLEKTNAELKTLEEKLQLAKAGPETPKPEMPKP